jgi:hypothetical protein
MTSGATVGRERLLICRLGSNVSHKYFYGPVIPALVFGLMDSLTPN